MLKRQGVLAGVADIILVHEGQIYVLELKAENGRPTYAQLDFIARLENAGGYGCIAHGLDRALAILTAWGLLK